uniref:hypothetical protein n=1 Tax=Desulfurobacterium sp. TaxID=2004706 RepID=UPI0026203657
MGVLERLFCTLRGDKPLVIRKINPFSVEIPSGFKELYGYKVLSGTERVLTLGEDTIEKISAFKGTEPNRYLYFVIARDREPKTGLFKTDIYMFGHEPAFLDLTAKTLGEKKFQKLKGYEIANILTNLAFVKNRLSITPQRKIIEMNNYFSEKDLGPTQEKSYNIMKELDWENIKVYWGGEYKGTQVDWDTVLSLPWTGVLYITIDVNDQSFSIKKKREKSIQDVKTFAEMQENIEKGTKDYVGISIAFYTRDEDVEDYIINLFYALGFVPLKKNYGIEMLVRGTPLLYKDFDFFFQTTPLLAEQYGIYQFTKNVMPKEVGIYGMDRFGSYVAYNIFEENENAHCVIVAPPGSGKSVGIQKMVTTILKVDIEKLINGEAQDIENVRIRHIDKGFSAELFYKLLKLRGFKVDIMSPRPSEIAFNPCEIESEEDYEFSEQIINLCLEAIKQEPLKGFESSFYKRALKIAKESDIRKTYYSKTISSLNKIEPLKDVVQELYKRGYTDRDIIGEIKEPEFSFLLQPVLSDVYRVLNDWDVSGLTKKEREELDSLIAKINALLQEPMLNIPAKISFKNTQIFYMDYEFLRESKFFAPIMLTILK